MQETRGSTHGLRRVLSVIVVAALAGAIHFFSVERVLSSISPHVWHHSLFMAISYAVVLALSGYIALLASKLRPSLWAAGMAALLLLSGSLGAYTGIGLGAGLALPLIVIPTAVVGRILLYSRGAELGISFTEALTTAVTTATVVGAVWLGGVAPAYAEGFVVLAWLVIAWMHLLVLAGLWVVQRGMKQSRDSQQIRIVAVAGTLMVSGIVGLGTIYFVILSEGSLADPLEAPGHWPQAFQYLSDSAETPAAAVASLKKVDLVELLKDRYDETKPSHLATLFLLTGEKIWAQRFKAGLLDLVQRKAHTGGEGSVKYGQRIVMLWAMYYREITTRMPALFDDDERQRINDWFLDVAEAVFSPGWVDYLYAVPFRDDPDGPYLNQEIGAGLVAVLNDAVMASDRAELKQKFQEFLENKSVGWRRNFRNQDDSLEYQDVWMGSAHALYRYVDGMDPEKAPGLAYGFEWLHSQLPAKPFPFNYGLPVDARPIDTLAIGAFILNDRHSKWLLDQHLLEIERHDEPFPKELTALWLWREMPSAEFRPRSVQLLGPTGYVFRPGALRPDKIVMHGRASAGGDGGMYALLSLRNNGWHRYPATNTVINLSLGDKRLLAEDIEYLRHKWLPKGRASHRDKKIDRSRLNGLMLARSGLDAWIGGMTGIYSNWRQDVPYFAETTQWARVAGVVFSKIELTDWDGLVQERWYLLEGDSYFLVVDRIADARTRNKAILWQMTEHVALDGESGAGSRARLKVATTPKAKVGLVPREGEMQSVYSGAAVENTVMVGFDHTHQGIASLFSLNNSAPVAAVVLAGKKQQIIEFGQEGKVFVLGDGEPWQYLDFSSDARLAILESDADRLRLTLHQPGFVHFYQCDSIDRVSIDGNESVRPLCEDGASRLSLDNAEVATILFRKD